MITDFLPYKESHLYQIDVPSYKVYEKDDEQFVLYLIDIITIGPNGSWRVEKRFSEIYDFNEMLNSLFSHLPKLPSKTLFKVIEHEDVEERREELKIYFSEIAKRNEIVNSEAFVEFFFVLKFAPSLLVQQPKLEHQLNNFGMNIRDFHFSNNELFLALSQTNYIDKIDAFFSNWNNEAKTPLGSLQLWQTKEEGKIEQVWKHNFAVEAICLFWEPISSNIAVGLDNGIICFGHVPEPYTEMKDVKHKGINQDQVQELQVHQQRVMGVYYDKNNNTLHSIGKDGYYKVYSFSSKEYLIELNLNNDLYSLAIWKERKIAMIGNSQGQIHVFDIATSIPQQITILKGSSKHIIRGLAFDNAKGYVFAGGYQGSIQVFDLQKQGKERFGRQTANFRQKEKTRVVCWSKTKRELYVGNGDGSITIWSVPNAQPIYVIQAHSEYIDKLEYMEDEEILISTSNDQTMKFWKMPKLWSEQKSKLEEEKEQQIKQSIIQERKETLQEKNAKVESDEEDELNDWHK